MPVAIAVVYSIVFYTSSVYNALRHKTPQNQPHKDIPPITVRASGSGVYGSDSIAHTSRIVSPYNRDRNRLEF